MTRIQAGNGTKTLSEEDKKVHAADIVHHGTSIQLPVGMEVKDAIGVLERRLKYLEEDVSINETFDAFPWDGANALDETLQERYGWVPAVATPSFWGPIPPKLITIETSPTEKKQVPWGMFSLPNITGSLETDVDMKNGHVCFAVSATVKRKDEAEIKEIFSLVRSILRTRSIYRGKAFKITFTNDQGKKLSVPEPKFIDARDIDPDTLIFSDDIQNAIETNLFTPIRRIADCKLNGLPTKRGILLGGTYGTGKTLAAKVASRYATESGVTFLYVTKAEELADAVKLAALYNDPGCVVFCEDIDRAMSGERTEKIDEMLNIIDGIDAKNSNVIVVLTTNNLENINPAMLRPGRLDAVIHVTAPDAKAVEKLLRYYGGLTIGDEEDLTEVGKTLQGKIPAIIAEVVRRAKLAQLKRQEPGTLVTKITEDSLLEAAKTMDMQLELLYKDRNKKEATIDDKISNIVGNAMSGFVKRDELNGCRVLDD